MTAEPDIAVLDGLGVRVVAPLSAGRNTHWLVEQRGLQLVLRRWAQHAADVAYELRVLEWLAARGWPVAPAVEAPLEHAGALWSLAALLPGAPWPEKNSVVEQHQRGQLLAALHADLAQLRLGQRAPWRRCEAILADSSLDAILAAHAHRHPEEAAICQWHLHRARERVAGLPLPERPGIVIHGDFTHWNLFFDYGRLSGVLDFELAHWDHRIADFALAWRGQYDDVIHSYHAVAPLAPEEWALLAPMWWAFLVEGFCQIVRQGALDDGWTIKQLLRRSPLMGPDAAAFPGV